MKDNRAVLSTMQSAQNRSDTSDPAKPYVLQKSGGIVDQTRRNFHATPEVEFGRPIGQNHTIGLRGKNSSDGPKLEFFNKCPDKAFAELLLIPDLNSKKVFELR
ncbi:hypothetical protein [Candidatus Halocyntiibacter alkanivorans]|uniref:hypothetical protein n=1 Tax=Candidatus Halocynthiibacter alkanivorans TaxID=2267619 RepID=UPI00109BFE87